MGWAVHKLFKLDLLNVQINLFVQLNKEAQVFFNSDLLYIGLTLKLINSLCVFCINGKKK